jgi:transcriptional regulator with XRE-family HTH domain
LGTSDQNAQHQRKPSAVDIHVGSRVRLRRMTLSLSQEKLGEMLGLTFQQVQKYEKGLNRIGASRLFEIARVLGVPVQYFFEDAPMSAGHQPPREQRSVGQGDGLDVIDFVTSREGIDLNRAFAAISEPKVRRSIIELVRNLADGEV